MYFPLSRLIYFSSVRVFLGITRSASVFPLFEVMHYPQWQFCVTILSVKNGFLWYQFKMKWKWSRLKIAEVLVDLVISRHTLTDTKEMNLLNSVNLMSKIYIWWKFLKYINHEQPIFFDTSPQLFVIATRSLLHFSQLGL